MTVAAQKLTAAEFLELPEVKAGTWLELVDGEVVVSPRPNRYHSHAGIKLIRILDTYIEDRNLGLLYSELDTVFDEDMVRIPDLLYYGPDRVIPADNSPNDLIPDLCIEILSPSNARTDRVEKFELYKSKGVKFYWIVDPEERTIEAYALTGGEYVSAGRGADDQVVKLPPFLELDIPLARLWHPRPKRA
jgi:Uma2 family endonuclease